MRIVDAGMAAAGTSSTFQKWHDIFASMPIPSIASVRAIAARLAPPPE
jgi:hypothetical protein